ncbi:hypothetical protein Leryth_020177 [Lithospermum erythrorhizon]|nr:hypothetical protein Leryth_020177 [Lithospermum erythrorhizon]
MVIPYSLVLFFFLSLLVHIFHLVEGQERREYTCPKEFECGKLGTMRFPFTNYHRPSCGPFWVNCHEQNPRIDVWVEEEFPEVWPIVARYSVNQIQIEVPGSCLGFQNLSLPRDESTSFTITSKLTSLVKCHSRLSDDEVLKFLPTYKEIRDCEVEHGFTIYYNNSRGTISDHNGPPPPNCSTIQLPLENRRFDPDHFSDMLAKEISLEWNVSKPWPCYKCFDDGHECIGVQDSDNHNTYHCSKGNSKLALILGSVSCGTFSLLIIWLIVLIIWRKKKKNKDGSFLHSRKILAHCWEIESNDHQNIENFLRNHGSGSAPKRFKYYDIKRITSSFKDKLGQGGFGSVYKGYLDDKNPVAVKFLSTSKGTGEEFINEVTSISNTSHVNVVKLLGFCFEYNKRALVYEYMPNGSLEKYIFSDKSVVHHQLGWPTLFKIAVGINVDWSPKPSLLCYTNGAF